MWLRPRPSACMPVRYRPSARAQALVEPDYNQRLFRISLARAQQKPTFYTSTSQRQWDASPLVRVRPGEPSTQRRTQCFCP